MTPPLLVYLVGILPAGIVYAALFREDRVRGAGDYYGWTGVLALACPLGVLVLVVLGAPIAIGWLASLPFRGRA